MNILFLHHQGHLLDGSAKALLNVVSLMKQEGHNIYVIVPNKGALLAKLNSLSIETKVVKYRILSYPKWDSFMDLLVFIPRVCFYLLLNFLSILPLCIFIYRKKIDIIHTNVGPLQIGNLVAKLCKVAHVWHIREYFEYYGYKGIPTTNCYRRKLHNKRNHCIAITRSIFNYNNLDKVKDTIIYDGVITSDDLPNIKNKKEGYILYVGGLIQQKGIDDLLFAYKKSSLSERKIKLLIAGPILDTSFSRNMQQIIHLNDNIELLGFRTDIEDLMKRALCLVIPSRQEGFGFVSIEAMRVGCPIIGRNVAGLKEQFDIAQKELQVDVARRFVEKEDLIEIFNTYTISYFDVDLAKKLQKYVLSTYTSKVCVDNILNFYNKILEKKI